MEYDDWKKTKPLTRKTLTKIFIVEKYNQFAPKHFSLKAVLKERRDDILLLISLDILTHLNNNRIVWIASVFERTPVGHMKTSISHVYSCIGKRTRSVLLETKNNGCCRYLYRCFTFYQTLLEDLSKLWVHRACCVLYPCSLHNQVKINC